MKHGFPALLSFFCPGLGQLVKGKFLRGIGFFFGVVFGMFLLVVPGIIIWIWCVSDAYNNN